LTDDGLLRKKGDGDPTSSTVRPDTLNLRQHATNTVYLIVNVK